jgi:hypothetical protein
MGLEEMTGKMTGIDSYLTGYSTGITYRVLEGDNYNDHPIP